MHSRGSRHNFGAVVDMDLGRIIGTVVATTRVPGLDGVKLLIVQPVDDQDRPIGAAVVAADGVAMAGPGDLVTFVASREAALTLPETFVPVDHAITAIVDAVEPPTPRSAS